MDSKLLEMLVCPVTKGPLVYDRQRQELVSQVGAPCVPDSRDGIPVSCSRKKRAGWNPQNTSRAGK